MYLCFVCSLADSNQNENLTIKTHTHTLNARLIHLLSLTELFS